MLRLKTCHGEDGFKPKPTISLSKISFSLKNIEIGCNIGKVWCLKSHGGGLI